MKTKILLLLMLIAGLGITSCTEDFSEINENPTAITKDAASARYFFTSPQVGLHGPNRYAYWRAMLIHGDRYAGHFTFGFNGCWWSGGLGYNYSSGYTDAAWGHYSGYFGSVDNFLSLTSDTGEFSNELMFSVGKIMQGLYYQRYTDIFGMLPYSQAGQPGIVTPEFDSQATIYKGIISDLNAAMETIGDNATTGSGKENLGSNDLYYNGDLQKWKKLANTLKLRLGLRAYGADGAGFAETAIQEAVNSGMFLSDETDNALLPKDVDISQWSSAAYGDVWHNFGGQGSKWNVSRPVIDYLREYDDPRLSKYAQTAPGGTITLDRGNLGVPEYFDKYVSFVTDMLDSSDVNYEYNVITPDSVVEIVMPENTNYVGQPVRLSLDFYPFAKNEFFSYPAEIITNPKGSSEIFPEIVMSTADAYFMRATAAALGVTSEDAQTLYQEGIRYAMKLWDVSDAEIEAYLANSEMATLGGTQEEQIRKITIQRWLASLTDGFEAWTIVRKWGYPESLAEGVDDNEIYSYGDLGGTYPQRMRYGNAVYDNNQTNAEAANSKQGEDIQGTKLWWADWSK